jgi:hypothetical protein
MPKVMIESRMITSTLRGFPTGGVLAAATATSDMCVSYR